jgi:hypothetical protein
MQSKSQKGDPYQSMSNGYAAEGELMKDTRIFIMPKGLVVVIRYNDINVLKGFIFPVE